ncbi:MAG: hypothetical protein CVV23_16170 [Ignavibacteriae bacterium HGW-Ignavibacteriae-2]|jgi:hypothetical protein|nr:MAG: hypothetical protein CVV23_16170 [Ignavibacteriae bacterium HGW-Ignavibacteriae-2]
MRFKLFFLAILSSMLLFACGKTDEVQTAEQIATEGHRVKVEEVLQATSYTYLRVTEGENEVWLAVTTMSVEPGATMYYKGGLEMNNFESRDLKRTFEKVLFVDQISAQPMGAGMGMAAPSPHSGTPVSDKLEIKIEPVAGGISIGDLSSQKTSYENKTVKVKGKVTKYNSGIMDRNWVHIQDGTADGKNFDLTITTNDEVKLGDVVIFEGKIILNKDFGMGYSYEILMEDAKLVKN